MVIGFDLDGVVFNQFFNGWFRSINLTFIHFLKKISVLKNIFYKAITINQEMAEIIKQLSERGDQIVIISGHSDGCLNEVENLFVNNKIPFDKICLFSKKNKFYFEFKLIRIIQERCNIYVEDRKDIVDFLDKELKGSCQIIHFKGNHSLAELRVLLGL